jgi:hypothetical protein
MKKPLDETLKKFCIAGPVDPERHYFIPRRLDWDQMDSLIHDREYFVLHAPRQSGKTTAIEEYIHHLNGNGAYRALYINVESAQAAREDIKMALIAILAELKTSLQDQLQEETLTIQFIDDIITRPYLVTLTTLADVLEFWARASLKPTILFIDEIDALISDSLLSVLRQIRRGFTKRPHGFPQSICLIGLRDVRDYRVWSKELGQPISTSSPFNIKAISLTLANFSLDQVSALYRQHTEETGQRFTEEAILYAYNLTQGQPWLVNALANQACFVDVIDRALPITNEVLEKAKDALIARRDTHIDSLVDKLYEPRVRNVIDAIINGSVIKPKFTDDDIQYTIDLGLVSSKAAHLQIANPIYQEIIPAVLAWKFQMSIVEEARSYLRSDGSLDMSKLLDAFTQFFRENSQAWLEDFQYKESAPHILMLAFLQRIINGGGYIHREYALGTKRVDLLVRWKHQTFIIELKIKYGEDALKKGLEQTAQYMDTTGASEGFLVIFDRDPTRSWEEKISKETISLGSKSIEVRRL